MAILIIFVKKTTLVYHKTLITMQHRRPLIFLSNDDGIGAPGLNYLIETVKPLGDIVVVAPDGPQSGKSSAITVDRPLRLTIHSDQPGLKICSVDGTPVDCVKLGLHAAVNRRPDIIIGGINHGSNSGNSVIYSGTMGIVMEGCMVGIPSVGFSLLHHSIAADFTACGQFVTEIVTKILTGGLPDHICLNVNIPASCTPKGMKVTEASRGHWTEEYADYTDPSGHPFYWLTGHYVDDDPDNPDTDNYWLDREYVTIVPVLPDQTAREAIPEIRRLLKLD